MEQLLLGLAVRIEKFPLAKSRKRNERNDLPAHIHMQVTTRIGIKRRR